MTVSTFGVTAATVRANRFPHLAGSWGADTAPTATTVATFINQRAAYLGAGMNGVVAKPISPTALVTEIQRLSQVASTRQNAVA